jgi:hypothetical protein
VLPALIVGAFVGGGNWGLTRGSTIYRDPASHSQLLRLRRVIIQEHLQAVLFLRYSESKYVGLLSTAKYNHSPIRVVFKFDR